MKKFFSSDGKWNKKSVYPVNSPETSLDNAHKNTMPSTTAIFTKGSENIEQAGKVDKPSARGHLMPIKSDEESSNAQKSDISDSAVTRSLTKIGKTYLPKMFDVWTFGIATVIGGQYYGWNTALKAGFGSYCIAQVLMGLAYINLVFSLSEIISTTSFSGGAYGMARIVLGFYAGFIVAAFELMEYISYISFSAVYIGEFVCDTVGIDHGYSALICLIFYFLSLLFVLEQDKWFWRLNYILGLLTLIILLIYCFGGLAFVNFSKNATLNDLDADGDDRKNWFAGGMAAFLQCLPYTTWGFGGIESAALITDMVEDPRKNLSYGMSLSVCTLFFCMVFIMFVACSLPPGLNDFMGMDYFMDAGWGLLGVSSYSAEWLIFPAQIAMAFGFFLPSVKLLYSMAQSNLVPQIFGLKEREAGVVKHDHRLSCVYVVTLSYLLCLVTIFVPQLNLENVPILLAQFTYLSDLYAFYRMRIDFPTRDYKFRNPFGIIGAAFAALYFILTAIAVIGFMDDYVPVIFVGVYGILLSTYYFTFAKEHQSFSDDEQKSLLKLHVIKNNQRRRLQKAAQKKQQSSTTNNNQSSHSSNRFSNFSWSRISNTSGKSATMASRFLLKPATSGVLGAPEPNPNLNTNSNSNHIPATAPAIHTRAISSHLPQYPSFSNMMADPIIAEEENDAAADNDNDVEIEHNNKKEKKKEVVVIATNENNDNPSSSRRHVITSSMKDSKFDEVLNNTTKGSSFRISLKSIRKPINNNNDHNENDNDQDETEAEVGKPPIMMEQP